jgi:dTDP-4-dehydrorhamnose 3,5-epimerase
MQVTATPIPDVVVIEPAVFGDARGFFYESFNLAAFTEAIGAERTWVQDNHSRSAGGVLRGLHFQEPRPQGKLVRCTHGSIFDVAVDIRRSSPTFLQWYGTELSMGNHRQLWIPEGFAHGFVVTSPAAEVQYKTTDYYLPESDRGIRWDDPTVGVAWPISGQPILSDKDRNLPSIADVDLFD